MSQTQKAQEFMNSTFLNSQRNTSISFLDTNLMISPRSLKSVQYIMDKKRLSNIADNLKADYQSKLQKLNSLKDELENLRKQVRQTHTYIGEIEQNEESHSEKKVLFKRVGRQRRTQIQFNADLDKSSSKNLSPNVSTSKLLTSVTQPLNFSLNEKQLRQMVSSQELYNPQKLNKRHINQSSVVDFSLHSQHQSSNEFKSMSGLIQPNLHPYSIPESDLKICELQQKLLHQSQAVDIAVQENDQLKKSLQTIKQQRIHDQNKLNQIQPLEKYYSDLLVYYQHIENLVSNRKFISVHVKMQKLKEIEDTQLHYKDKISRRIQLAKSENEGLHSRSKSLQLKDAEIRKIQRDMDQIREGRKRLEIQKSICQESIQTVSQQFRIIRILKALQIIIDINENKDVFRQSFGEKMGEQKDHFSSLNEKIFELQLVAGDLNSYKTLNMSYQAMQSEEQYQKFLDIMKHFQEQYNEVKGSQLDIEGLQTIFNLQYVESQSLESHYQLKLSVKQEKVKDIEDLEFLKKSLIEYEEITDYLALLDLAKKFKVDSSVILDLKSKNIQIQSKVLRNIIKSYSQIELVIKQNLINHYNIIHVAILDINKALFHKYGQDIDQYLLVSNLKPHQKPFQLKIEGGGNLLQKNFKKERSNSRLGRGSSLSQNNKTQKRKGSQFISNQKQNTFKTKSKNIKFTQEIEVKPPITEVSQQKNFLQVTDIEQSSSSALSRSQFSTSKIQTEEYKENINGQIIEKVDEIFKDLRRINVQLQQLENQDLPLTQLTMEEEIVELSRSNELMAKRQIMALTRSKVRERMKAQAEKRAHPQSINENVSTFNSPKNNQSSSRKHTETSKKILDPQDTDSKRSFSIDEKVQLFKRGQQLKRFELQEGEFQRRFKQKINILK